jgi:hypothetical protein
VDLRSTISVVFSLFPHNYVSSIYMCNIFMLDMLWTYPLESLFGYSYDIWIGHILKNMNGFDLL